MVYCCWVAAVDCVGIAAPAGVCGKTLAIFRLDEIWGGYYLHPISWEGKIMGKYVAQAIKLHKIEIEKPNPVGFEYLTTRLKRGFC